MATRQHAGVASQVGHGSGAERIYYFRCRCGRAGTRRARSALVELPCSACGAVVSWWRSVSVDPFVPPPPVGIEMDKAEREEILRDGSWKKLTHKHILEQEARLQPPLQDDVPHAATATATDTPTIPKCPHCRDRDRVGVLSPGVWHCKACDLLWEPAPNLDRYGQREVARTAATTQPTLPGFDLDTSDEALHA